MKNRWQNHNRTELLVDGDEFFPRVFDAIAQAKQEVLLETFILANDKVGRELRERLIEAAERGVTTMVMVDGFGSPGLEGEFLDGLTRAGVKFQVFNPGVTLFGYRTNLFRRMHRKIVVIDGKLAYVGGINFIADQLSDFGPEAKRDYVAEIEGPVVDDIRRFVLKTSHHVRYRPLTESGKRESKPDSTANTRQSGHNAQVLFVQRDNRRERNSIERQYHMAIRNAQKEIIIANAYFLPGYRLLWRLRQAARRGVHVILILQGRPDFKMVHWASRQLYGFLANGGVEIYEYCEKPLHGKVAIVDNEWSTIGSSNLDPLSLSLNLEANVIIRDAGFNQKLREQLLKMKEKYCRRMGPEDQIRSHWWSGLTGMAVFHILRHFPNWASQLPAHTIVLKPMHEVNQTGSVAEQDNEEKTRALPVNSVQDRIDA